MTGVVAPGPIRIGHFGAYGSTPIKSRASTRIFTRACFGAAVSTTRADQADADGEFRLRGHPSRSATVDVEDYLATLRGNELFQGRYFVSATAAPRGDGASSCGTSAEWVQVVASYNRAFDWAGSTAGLTHRVKTAVVSSTNPSHQSARGSLHSQSLGADAPHRFR